MQTLEIPENNLCAETLVHGHQTPDGLEVTGISMRGGFVDVYNANTDPPQDLLTLRRTATVALIGAGMKATEIAEFTGATEGAIYNRLVSISKTLDLESTKAPQIVEETFAHGILAVRKHIELSNEKENEPAWNIVHAIAQGEHFADHGRPNSVQKQFGRKIKAPFGLRTPASAVMFAHLTGMRTVVEPDS